MYPALARFFGPLGISRLLLIRCPQPLIPLNPTLAKQILPWIFRLDAIQFFHQVANTFVGALWHDHLHLDVLITARAVSRARNTLLPQTQRASAVGSRRNLHQRTTVNR